MIQIKPTSTLGQEKKDHTSISNHAGRLFLEYKEPSANLVDHFRAEHRAMSYDLDLIESCKNAGIPINTLHPIEKYLSMIEEKYPTKGGRINLSSLLDYKYSKASSENTPLDFCNFAESIPNLNDNDSNITYIGDSLTDNAYTVRSSDLQAFICAIVDIPQSHYLFRSDLSWCISLSFENDMEFARISV